jgi:ubiquinone/menaquinone biosynthesis C-methylase UbiE
MAANYNNSAWFYDSLAQLVYGRELVRSQVYLLQYVPQNSSILIVGGGTGWILEELAKIHPSGLQITYVEVARAMMSRSKKRDCGANKVIFINDAIEKVAITQKFDVVITPFLFDNFTEQTLQKVFECIHQHIAPNGIWLNNDFQLTGKWWQNFLLKSMFLFFRITCNIEASQLPAIKERFGQHGYKPIAEQTFFNDFIIAGVYTKN